MIEPVRDRLLDRSQQEILVDWDGLDHDGSSMRSMQGGSTTLRTMWYAWW
ncbi:MAG: hypothetical protein H0V93_08885 [Euzebyales bacterium]|nr:hypothetical protein [Euzebyales bacterium]